MLKRGLIFVGMLGLALLVAKTTLAHASLYHSNPAANAVLEKSPSEIRLWFTEPLEADFSSFSLRNQDGVLLDTPESQVDSADAHQLFMQPAELPDGLYTVAWRVVSSADGHQTRGSFPFVIGEPIAGFGVTNELDEPIPTDSATIRWLNLLSLALSVGSISFWLFVWQPAIGESHPTAERRMRLLIWAGWWLVGITAILTLRLQVSLATGNPVFGPVNEETLRQVVTETRFGRLWIARNVLWAIFGVILLLARHDRRFYWNAFVLGGVILFTHSLFSHASAAQEKTAAVAADWFHLTASALWIGGLIQFINVIGPVRREFAGTDQLAKLVGHFSNMARVTVAALIVTGTYAAWLQIGSIDGLFDTCYGQSLLIKLLLMLPLLAIAGINLVLTHRGLNTGKIAWGRRLQGLLGAEITLVVTILAVVGVMTAIAPARGVIELRKVQAATSTEAPANPIVETKTADDLNIQLGITPGYVGENIFTVTLTDRAGNSVENASLIRLRFESQSENLGENELRPTHQGGGVYTINGTNLSTPGEWRLRLSVQRPDMFDALADFNPQVSLPPARLPPPLPPDTTLPLPNQTVALLLTGLAALMVGGFIMGQSRLQLLRADGLLAMGFIGVGGVFLISSLLAAKSVAEPSSRVVAYVPLPDAPIHMIFAADTKFPYLLTSGGTILRPIGEGQWQSVPLEAEVNDLYVDTSGVMWAATDAGLRVYRDEAWQVVDDVPTQLLEMTHGYLFSMGMGEIMRGPEHWRLIDVPLANASTGDLVMMGNHTHVLKNGEAIFQTADLGLGWTPLNAPGPVKLIWFNEDDNLLVVTDQAIYTWNYFDASWSNPIPLPDTQIDAIRQFNGRYYVVAGGKLYLRANREWQEVELPDSSEAFFYGLAVQYPGTLWVLDSSGAALWSTSDGTTWQKTEVLQIAP